MPKLEQESGRPAEALFETRLAALYFGVGRPLSVSCLTADGLLDPERLCFPSLLL